MRVKILSALSISTLIALVSPFAHSADRADDACAGSPPAAVLNLPHPLSDWGTLTCTSYGHVIEAGEGWIWSRPGAFSPVWIPAQMVRRDPAPVGNKAYFQAIEMAKVDGDDAKAAIEAFRSIFHGTRPNETYRLDVTSNSGKALRLFFFVDRSIWGIWCTTQCDPSSVFMLLNMAKRPE